MRSARNGNLEIVRLLCELALLVCLWIALSVLLTICLPFYLVWHFLVRNLVHKLGYGEK